MSKDIALQIHTISRQPKTQQLVPLNHLAWVVVRRLALFGGPCTCDTGLKDKGLECLVCQAQRLVSYINLNNGIR